MSTRIDQFRAEANNRRPATAVRLESRLRTHAGSERVILAYELEYDNDVWFDGAPGNPGRRKVIEFRETADSSGFTASIESGLFCGPNDQRRTAIIRVLVLPAGGGNPMHTAADEIFIR